MKIIITLFLIVCCITTSICQGKIEREKKIKQEAIPTEMNQTLKSLINKASKVKYFEEFDGEQITYECKFKLHKQRYSAEFDSIGKLEDIEVIVCFTELSKDLQQTISEHLVQYPDFKIQKTQKQYSSDLLSDRVVIQHAFENSLKPTIRYEIIVELKEKKSWSVYEMLFDSDGYFISQLKVIGRSEDHILY